MNCIVSGSDLLLGGKGFLLYLVMPTWRIVLCSFHKGLEAIDWTTFRLVGFLLC